MKNFSIENLKKIPEFIAYEPETGNFRRLQAIGNRFKVGEVAGSINKQGYVRIMMFGMAFQGHRLAFYFMTGELPPEDLEVDHINGVRSDNKWTNLRLVTHAVNMQNSRTPKHNTSGHPGILYIKANGKWAARISLNGRMVQLGEFIEKQDAIECYLEGKRKMHEGFVGIEGKAAVLEHQRLSGADAETNAGGIMANKPRYYQTAVHKNITRDRLVRSVNPSVAEKMRAILEELKRKEQGHE